MGKAPINRRAFLEASAMGAALIATGGIFSASAVEEQKKGAMSLFVCSVCGHVEFGATPAACPVCHAPKDKFISNDSLFTDAQEAETSEAPEKHIPVISIVATSTLIKEKPTKDIAVRIGKQLHPMEEAHHIQWIDCYVDNRYISRLLLTPGANPAVNYYPKISGSKIRIVEHCNLHGHWQAEMAL
jgi:superoxide reductase